MKKYYVKGQDGFREADKEEYRAYCNKQKQVLSYAAKVRAGETALSDVPEEYRADVEIMLAPSDADKAAAYDILMGVSE